MEFLTRGRQEYWDLTKAVENSIMYGHYHCLMEL